MDTNSMYMASSDTSIDDTVRPELQEEHNYGGKNQVLVDFKVSMTELWDCLKPSFRARE